jgi:hypothetical protein
MRPARPADWPVWRRPGNWRTSAVAFFRVLFLLLFLAAAVSFAFFAVTGQARYKRFGLLILKATLFAAFAFFAVLIVQRLTGSF